MSRFTRLLAAAAAVVAAFTVDQLTKAWALSYLDGGRDIDLGLGVSLRLVFNPGVAFGLGGDVGAPLVVGVMVLVAALLTWIVIRVLRRQSMGATALLAAALGGAIGNLWDRTTRAETGPLSGEVVDFIAVDWFAIFNVADIFTTLGLLGWAALYLLRRDHAPISGSTGDGSPHRG